MKTGERDKLGEAALARQWPGLALTREFGISRQTLYQYLSPPVSASS